MLPLALLAGTLAAVPRPIPLERLSIDQAQTLNGQEVTVTFIVAKPTYTWKGRTIIGAADQPDDVERGADLKGERYDVKEGKLITVTGKLRFIHHPPAFVGVVLVEAWYEIRVEEGK